MMLHRRAVRTLEVRAAHDRVPVEVRAGVMSAPGGRQTREEDAQLHRERVEHVGMEATVEAKDVALAPDLGDHLPSARWSPHLDGIA